VCGELWACIVPSVWVLLTPAILSLAQCIPQGMGTEGGEGMGYGGWGVGDMAGLWPKDQMALWQAARQEFHTLSSLHDTGTSLHGCMGVWGGVGRGGGRGWGGGGYGCLWYILEKPLYAFKATFLPKKMPENSDKKIHCRVGHCVRYYNSKKYISFCLFLSLFYATI
jgi:hypothetical protein